MKKVYFLSLLIVLLFHSSGFGQQCSVKILTSKNNTQLDCNNTSITLTADSTANGETYKWNTGDTTQSIKVTSAGTYSVTTTIPVGEGSICTTFSSIIITSDTTKPAIIVRAFPGEICQGSSSSLIASGAVTYVWQPGSLPGDSISVKPVTTTSYTVTGTDANGCTGIGSYMVIVDTLPSATISSTNATSCQYDAVSPAITFQGFGGKPPFIFQYTVNGGFQQSVATTGSNTSITIPVSVGQTGTFVYRLTAVTNSNNCTQPLSQQAAITISPAPFFTSATTDRVCSGSLYSYTAISSTPNTGFTWVRMKNSLITPDTNNGTTPIISETLISSVKTPVIVKYVFTSIITGTNCQKMDTLTVTVYPTPVVDPITYRYVFCNGANAGRIDFTSQPSSGASFNWLSSANIGFGTKGTTPYIPNFSATNKGISPVIATVSVTATANGCLGPATTFPITVNPSPRITSPIQNYTYCNGDYGSGILFSSNASEPTITWKSSADIGFHTAGYNPIPSFTATDTISAPVKAIITVHTKAVGCSSENDTSFIITVNPTPKVDSITIGQNSIALGQATYCNGSSVDTIKFKSLTPGSSFIWTSNADIGFGTSSGGYVKSIPAFKAKNNGLTQIVATISVTATANGCSGPATTFTILVNPAPKIDPVQNRTVCNGESVPPIYFTSSTLGTILSWSRTNQNIGITDSSGSYFIPSFTAGNTDTAAIIETINVSGKVAGCSSDSTFFTITVNPTPKVNYIAPQTYCGGTSVPAIYFNSSPQGADFTWTYSSYIGFDTTTRKDYIPNFLAQNKSAAPLTTTIRVTPTLQGCTGPDSSFKITINPSPPKPVFTSFSGTADTVVLNVCESSKNINFNVINPLSDASGVSYFWSASDITTAEIRNDTLPNTVINFKKAGTVSIAVAVRYDTTTCSNVDLQTIEVANTNDADTIVTQRILEKLPDHILIYPDNSLAGYQWGYDSIISDSPRMISEPKPLQKQVYQFLVPESRFINNGVLDTVHYYYWALLTNKAGCSSRIYYNGPYDDKPSDDKPVYTNNNIQLKVIPNPNKGVFRIDLQGNMYGTIEAQVYNSAGQLVYRKKFVKTSPGAIETFITSGLQSGIYYLQLRSSDLREVHTRFIVGQ